jgi:hypothetical protein
VIRINKRKKLINKKKILLELQVKKILTKNRKRFKINFSNKNNLFRRIKKKRKTNLLHKKEIKVRKK